MITCTAVTPELGIRCTKGPHSARFACAASGTSNGVHWTLSWWRPGQDSDARADGLPWDADTPGPTEYVGDPSQAAT